MQRLLDVGRFAEAANQPSEAMVENVAVAIGSAPLSPAQALQIHSAALTGFEQSEILQYPEVYFWGLPGARKHEGTPHSPDLNHGCVIAKQ